MKQYLDLVRDIFNHGVQKGDRTGTGTLSVFGRQLRFNLQHGFPAVTTKKLHFKSIIHELLWFISGGTNVWYLQDNGVKIWDAWARENGNLGPVYGSQWRAWGDNEGLEEPIDQLAQVIARIKTHPDCRRHIVSAWNVGDVPDMALPPCHFVFQFYVANGRLSCHMNMRSVDVFLGLPFNIASYALLTHMVAHVTGLVAGDLVISTGDTHLYLNHLKQAREQLGRGPMDLPTLLLEGNRQSIDDFVFEDVQIEGYKSHPAIKAPISV